MVDTIAELASLSKTLNEKSDTLNATIIAINKKLAALNFGMRVTLGGAPIDYEDTKYYLTYGKHRSPVENKGGPVSYTLSDEHWQLGIYDERQDREQALLRAPREVRIRALDLVPALLDVMKHKAAGLISSLDRAEKLAENL